MYMCQVSIHIGCWHLSLSFWRIILSECRICSIHLAKFGALLSRNLRARINSVSPWIYCVWNGFGRTFRNYYVTGMVLLLLLEEGSSFIESLVWHQSPITQSVHCTLAIARRPMDTCSAWRTIWWWFERLRTQCQLTSIRDRWTMRQREPFAAFSSPIVVPHPRI